MIAKEYITWDEAKNILHCTDSKLRMFIANDRITDVRDGSGEIAKHPSYVCSINKQQVYDFLKECGVDLAEDDVLWDADDIAWAFSIEVYYEVRNRSYKGDLQCLKYITQYNKNKFLHKRSDVCRVAEEMGISRKN